MTLQNVIKKIRQVLEAKIFFDNSKIVKRIEKYFCFILIFLNSCYVLAIFINNIKQGDFKSSLLQEQYTILILYTSILVPLSILINCIKEIKLKVLFCTLLIFCSLEYGIQAYLCDKDSLKVQFNIFFLILIKLNTYMYRTNLQFITVFIIIIYLSIRVAFNIQLADCIFFLIWPCFMTLFIDFNISHNNSVNISKEIVEQESVINNRDILSKNLFSCDKLEEQKTKCIIASNGKVTDPNGRCKNTSNFQIVNTQLQNMIEQSNLILNVDNFSCVKKPERFSYRDKEIDEQNSLYANAILSSLQTGIALINNSMELSYCNNEMKRIFNSQDYNQVKESILDMRVKENQRSGSQKQTIKSPKTSDLEKDSIFKRKLSGLQRYQQNQNAGQVSNNNTYKQKDSLQYTNHSNLTSKSPLTINNQNSDNANQNMNSLDDQFSNQNKIISLFKDQAGFNIQNKEINQNQQKQLPQQSKKQPEKLVLRKQLSDGEKATKRQQSEKIIKFDIQKDSKRCSQANFYHSEKDQDDLISFTENSNIGLKQTRNNQDSSQNKKYKNSILDASYLLKQSTLNLFNINSTLCSPLMLKQCIIPSRVLQIFENEEFTLQEIIELIFEQQDRAYFNNCYSQNDILDYQDQGSGINNNKQFKSEQADKKESEGSVSYYTEKNNLVINIKQLGETDLKYTQLKIGFYILKNSNSLLDLNSQSFVLIEIFDQAQFTVNLFEQDITEYKNKMLASISHELRTPLNCSIQMLSLLTERLSSICNVYDSDSELNEINTSLVKPAFLSNQLLLNIINDILDFGQINTGNFKLDFASFNLYEVIKECVELMAFQATQKGLTLELSFDENLPELINTDANRLRQVLLNLLSNSLKFTESGQINVLVMRASDNDELIRIDVIDTGCGIPEENLSKVLECFGNKSKQKFLNTQGAGLGLSIANNLAMGLGGNKKIEISSKINDGTRFTFYVVNRALNKKGCEYRLKDVFNRKIIKWETLSQCLDNNTIPKVSSFNAVKFTQIISSKLKTLKLNQGGTLNTQISQVENNLEQHYSSMINNEITRKVENPNASEESNEMQSNLITFTFKPSQLHVLQQQKGLTQSFQQIPNLLPHSNHSQFDFMQKQKLNAPKQLRNNSSADDHNSHQTENILEYNDIIQIKFSDQKRNSKQFLQVNQQSGLNAKQESCQVVEEQVTKESILNFQERTIYNATKDREFQQDILLVKDQNIKDQNQIKSDNTLLYQNQRIQQIYEEGDFTFPSSSKVDDQSSELSKSVSVDNISNQMKNYNSPKSAKEKRYVQSKFNKNKSSHGNEYSSSSQNQEQSQKSFETNINSPTQLGRPIMIQLLKQVNQNKQCECQQILIVDDNDFNLYALAMKLQSYNLRVEKATSGQSAIDKVQAMHNLSTCCRKYKAILMDIDMPIKDGHQTTIEILYFYKSVQVKPPLISACSAIVQDSEKKKAKLSGMQYYITKPVQTNQLESFLLTVFQDQI